MRTLPLNHDNIKTRKRLQIRSLCVRTANFWIAATIYLMGWSAAFTPEQQSGIGVLWGGVAWAPYRSSHAYLGLHS